jgi:ribonuclease VapC
VTLDSSALVAILFSEPGSLELVDAILEADVVRVGAPTLVETGIVLAGRRGSPVGRELDGLVRELGLTIVPFGEAEWHRALDASNRSGGGDTPPR